MHGRVKVRTSEEEKAKKARECQEKLKRFKVAMQKIHSKRDKNELDKELLEVTGQILSSNPDIYTLWNIRREVLNILRNSGGDNEDISTLYDAELNLTEHSLKLNPKSYCAWHQREWVLTTRSDPDWKKELYLCEKYLKFDERNFHTWDYRRFVVSQCKSSLKDEFDFTTGKLLDNFSNYSAWHYRSKMLIALYPDLEGGRPIEDSHHKHELKLVQSAAYTDPDDTSAWFYQQWLLSAVKESTQIVVCVVTPEKTTLAFNKSIPNELISSKVRIVFNGAPITCTWTSCNGNKSDSLWICKHEQNVTNGLEIKVEFVTEECKQVLCCIEESLGSYVGRSKINFQNQYSQAVIEELKEQLEACRQLQQLEPDNRWTLLNTTIFLHCIDAKKYYKESMKNLHTLKKIDKLRRGYYDDLISKWTIEDILTSENKNEGCNFKLVSDERITSLPHMQYFSYVKDFDLSNHNLTSQALPSLIMLQHCKNLNLENNNITTLKSFPKLDMQVVNLKENGINPKEVEIFKQRTNINVFFSKET